MKRILSILVFLVVATTVNAQETTRFFAAAASANGANGTFWVTDARVFNPDPTETITVKIGFLRSDTDNSGLNEVELNVEARKAVALDDVVQSVLRVSGAGGIRLHSESPFFATSRTYNIGDGEAGTFGQYIPGLDPSDALQQGILLSITNDPADDGSRSNLGFVNPNGADVNVKYKIFDVGSGDFIGEGEKTLKALAFFQINNVFSNVGHPDLVLGNASIEFTAAMPVFVYASVVDNASGDAVFVLPNADVGTPDAINQAPEGNIVTPASDLTVTSGDIVDFVAAVSDPDGNEVTGMLWDFGDEISASGLEVMHTFTNAGVYVVSFTATDEFGLADPTPSLRTITVEAAAAASFSDVQQMVFNTSCAFSGCHGGGSQSAGLDLSEGNAYNALVNVPSSEQGDVLRVKPGNSDESYLYLKVIGDPSISGARMPRGGGALSQDLIDLLRSWIDGGAEDD